MAGGERSPDLGMLAAELLQRVQRELFAELGALGFRDVRPRHGAVTAYLTEEGVRLSRISELTGRNKQTLGAIVDELEELGYVAKVPDPDDRRARLIKPTERGLVLLRQARKVMDDMEERRARDMGVEAYRDFKQTLARLVGRD
jgi:DNA-binding MarR family transcriptional regulator